MYVFLCMHEQVTALLGPSVHHESCGQAAQRRKGLLSDRTKNIFSALSDRLIKSTIKKIFLSLASANHLPSFAFLFQRFSVGSLSEGTEEIHPGYLGKIPSGKSV